MEREKQSITVYLDTHVVMWLHDRLLDRLSKQALELIETGQVFVSPIVELELQYLHEIKRIRPSAQKVLQTLAAEIGLKAGEISFPFVVRTACSLTWTRDPFDRLIVGECMAANGKLVTHDRLILANYREAVR